MHLPGAVQRARQLATGLEDAVALKVTELRPLAEQAFQVAPVIQGTCQQYRPMLACVLALTVEHRLQGRDMQLLVTADVAELTGEGRLAKWAMQGAGQVVALALEVIPFALELQAIDAAPAATAGVGFVHSIELQRPQRLEVIQAMAFEQREVRAGQVIGHSLPSKKLST
ncbi:hypothetical protein D3C81_1314840 [compost metagenome]